DHPLLGELVEVRRSREGVAVAAEVRAVILAADPDDVGKLGPVLLLSVGADRQGEEQAEKNAVACHVRCSKQAADPANNLENSVDSEEKEPRGARGTRGKNLRSEC